ncbi:hypothetical protein ACEPAH_4988 [Sanghuangporus vaninii]
MSSSESGSGSSEIHYPPGSFHDRFSFSSESRPPTPVNVGAPINPIFEQRTRRKLDRRLIPVLGVLYAVAFIDATNIFVARREGADTDFNLLIDHRSYLVSFVFFLPTIFLQFPLNLALRRVGTALWLGTMTFLLGALQLAVGFVNGWGQFLGIRVVLGILEVSIFDFAPYCVYLISSWYKRSEMQVRITLFYSVSVFVGSFGNILALGLSKVHTKGIHGWRWIFALEGLITVLVSFYGFSAVLPFPDRKHSAHGPFLSHEELQLMRQRVELDRKDYVPDHLDKAKFTSYLSDVSLWLYALLALCANIVVYPVPIGIAATAMTLLSGFASSRAGTLCPALIFNFLLSTAGIGMIGFSDRRSVRFAGTFLSYSGAQANVPVILSLQAINVHRHSKRLFTVSLVASFGGVGAILSILAFPDSAALKYATGVRTALALQAAGVVFSVILMALLRHKNRGIEVMSPGVESIGQRSRGIRDIRNGADEETRSRTPGSLERSDRQRSRICVERNDRFRYLQ